MSPASAADRRHARSVELGIEIQVETRDAAATAERADAARRRAGVFTRGLLDALKSQDAIAQLQEAQRGRVTEIATELCGLLEGTAAAA